MNYVVSGRATNPALLLIPGQTESWWGFEKAIALLDKEFQVFAVDLRGQGRSTWTPRRYTLDNMGNDLVRFIALVIKRPVITSGCSSGGVLSAWLSAFAMPGQVRGSHYEDPPLFASEYNPLYGHSIRQSAVSASFQAFAKFLGDQWSIGDWKGMVASRAAARAMRTPARRAGRCTTAACALSLRRISRNTIPSGREPFSREPSAQSCPHERMLAQVKVPVLFTHHARAIDPATGQLSGAISDLQAAKVREIVTAAGQRCRIRLTARRGARDASSRSGALRAGADNVGQDTSRVTASRESHGRPGYGATPVSSRRLGFLLPRAAQHPAHRVVALVAGVLVQTSPWSPSTDTRRSTHDPTSPDPRW